MHFALLLIIFWALAFVTLAAALLLLNIYSNVIGNDIVFRNLRQEATIAAIAFLIEAASVWVILSFVPLAVRALSIPALILERPCGVNFQLSSRPITPWPQTHYPE